MTTPPSATRSEIQFLPVEQLHPNPWNRTQFDPDALKELARSIRAEGIREPLIVRQRIGLPEKRLANTAEKGSSIKETTLRSSGKPSQPSDKHAERAVSMGRPPQDGRLGDQYKGGGPQSRPAAVQPVYEIASGNRRWLAANRLGLKTVPCLVESLSDEQVAEDNITMNIQREDIPPLELARMIREYMDTFQKKQKDAARTFGKSKPWVSELLGFVDMVPASTLKKFKALNLGWIPLRAIRSLPSDLRSLIVQELEAGSLKPTRIVKRCNQLLFGSHSKGGFKSNPPPPDPLKQDWEKVHYALLQVASPVWWEVEYSRHKMPTGESGLGWFFFAMPQMGADREALAEWFTQMGKALRGGKLEDPIFREDATIKQAEQNLIGVLGARVPRTAEEQRELEQIAVRGTPQDVYEWIYGKGSPMATAVPFASWADAQLSPQEGLKLILDGIGGNQDGAFPK